MCIASTPKPPKPEPLPPPPPPPPPPAYAPEDQQSLNSVKLGAGDRGVKQRAQGRRALTIDLNVPSRGSGLQIPR